MNDRPVDDPVAEESFPVLWTARDVWLGLASFAGLSIITTGIFLLLIWGFSVDMSIELMLIIGELMFIAPIWWFALHKYGVGWKDLGFRKFNTGTLAVGFGLLIASYVLTILYAAIIVALFDSQLQPGLEPVAEEMAFPWLLIVLAVIVAPVVEELFFRGFVFAGFRRKYGWQKAALISSALFAVGHLQPFALVPLFMIGYIFAYLYHRSGSIWPGILLHFMVNLWGIIVEFVIAD